MKYIRSFLIVSLYYFFNEKSEYVHFVFLTSGMLVSFGTMLWSGDRTWENCTKLP